MRDARVIVGLVLAGIVGLYLSLVSLAPILRAEAIANAPVAALWLALAIDIAFPMSVAMNFATRRGLNAPVLKTKMFPIWALCVAGLAMFLVNVLYWFPAIQARLTSSLLESIGTESLLTPFLYWLVWPVIVSTGLLCVGIAAGYPLTSVVRSFARRFG